MRSKDVVSTQSGRKMKMQQGNYDVTKCERSNFQAEANVEISNVEYLIQFKFKNTLLIPQGGNTGFSTPVEILVYSGSCRRPALRFMPGPVVRVLTPDNSRLKQLTAVKTSISPY